MVLDAWGRVRKTPSAGAPYASHPGYQEDSYDDSLYGTATYRPRVKPEAQEFALRNRGTLGYSWDVEESSAAFTPTRAIGGRFCSLEGKENMLRSQGTVSTILQSNSSRTATPRTRQPEITENNGKRMNLLLTNYGKNEVTPRPAPRVKSEAAANYRLNTGKAMKVLHNPSSLPATARPAPRVKPEAENNAMKNRGTMNSIMRVSTPRY